MSSSAPVNPLKILPYNLEELSMNADGLIGYEWPISYKELVEAGLELEHSAAKMLREHANQESALPYKIIKQIFLNKACGYFQAHLLEKRMQAKGASFISIPNHFIIWKEVFENAVPSADPFLIGLRHEKKTVKTLSLQNLLHKLANPKRALALLKKMRLGSQSMQIDGLYISRPNNIDYNNNIVATQRLDIIHAHSKIVEEKVYFCPSAFWFSPISQEQLKKSSTTADGQELSDFLLKIVAQLYQSYALEFSDKTEADLRKFLDEATALITIHYRRLLSRNDLPRQLWTGTSGNIWDMMLRLAVMQKSGIVTAHDHAGGTAFTLSPQLGGVELWGTNFFTGYNERQAKLMQRHVETWPHLDLKIPDFKTINVSAEGGGRETRPPKGKKNILLFSTWYTGDLGRSYPIYPYLQYMDWQARLIFKLKERGYNVLLKPHPESVVETPIAFKKLGADIVNGRFEDLDINIDFYLLDMIKTSVFKPLLYTRTPIMIADFDYHKWDEMAQTFLEERCGYVRGDISENRFNIDWQRFFEELENSPKKICSDSLTRNFLD